MSKISEEVKKYVISRKLKNPDISCRSIASSASERFNVSISKSSINSILLNEKLMSPRGRSVSRIHRPSSDLNGAGFAFLLGSSLLLGMTTAIAKTVKKLSPFLGLKTTTMEAISEAWLMSKAVYNTSLDKIADYSKNQLWDLIGKKVSLGSLKRYLSALKMMQLFNSHMFSELSAMFQDAHILKFSMADGSFYLVDGRFYGLWDQKIIPFGFSTNISFANGYINSVVVDNEPLVIFNVNPEGVLGPTLTNFVFSLSGKSAEKSIIKAEIISPKGLVIKEVPFIVSGKKRFAVGVWPWQYKAIGEFEKKPATGIFYLDPTGEAYPFVDEEIRFSQHIRNNEVKLRMIVIKNHETGAARIGILTNIDRTESSGKDVVRLFVRRWRDFEGTRERVVRALKKPPYLEDFVLGEKILDFSKKILIADGPDEAFSVLVETLHIFSQRTFFPSEVSGWGFFKMRELFYKNEGTVKRDMADDILFNILKIKDLQQFSCIREASERFNEMNIMESPGRKLWIRAQKPS